MAPPSLVVAPPLLLSRQAPDLREQRKEKNKNKNKPSTFKDKVHFATCDGMCVFKNFTLCYLFHIGYVWVLLWVYKSLFTLKLKLKWFHEITGATIDLGLFISHACWSNQNFFSPNYFQQHTLLVCLWI